MPAFVVAPSAAPSFKQSAKFFNVHHLNADPAQLTRTNQLPLFGKKLSIQDDSLSRR
jgi:hypothetical protein